MNNLHQVVLNDCHATALTGTCGYFLQNWQKQRFQKQSADGINSNVGLHTIDRAPVVTYDAGIEDDCILPNRVGCAFCEELDRVVDTHVEMPHFDGRDRNTTAVD